MGEPEPRNMLHAVSGPLAGATFEVGDRVLIGRVPSCDILLSDTEVSREHAMIVSDGGRPTLVDLASRNGTFVDGERITRVGLEPGDAFSIADSKFVFDRSVPVTTKLNLQERLQQEPDEEERPTQETVVTKRVEPGVTPPRRNTVRLEAATGERPRPKDTVRLHAVDRDAAEAEPALEVAAEPPPSFAPPPPPQGKPRESNVTSLDAARQEAYPGDLLADVVAYRAFRLRLQRGEIPSGEEVARMIDMEAILREPAAESTRHRDVITHRYYRRFAFSAKVGARFAASGQLVEALGIISNLSVDGLRCTLELGDFSPFIDQRAMLVVDTQRDGEEVRYSITARVVYVEGRRVGFVFAGVPSWAARGTHQHAETAVRAPPEPPVS